MAAIPVARGSGDSIIRQRFLISARHAQPAVARVDAAIFHRRRARRMSRDRLGNGTRGNVHKIGYRADPQAVIGEREVERLRRCKG